MQSTSRPARERCFHSPLSPASLERRLLAHKYVRKRSDRPNESIPLKEKSFIAVLVLCMATVLCLAQEYNILQLPPPQTEIGKPLMQALKLRQSSRSFDFKPLPL